MLTKHHTGDQIKRHVARVWEGGFGEKSEGQWLLCSYRGRREDIIKTELNETGWEGVD
jgi:hypothetical protein